MFYRFYFYSAALQRRRVENLKEWGTGKHGEIKVAVTITDAKITNIEVVEQGENKGSSDSVYDELKEAIIAQKLSRCRYRFWGKCNE